MKLRTSQEMADVDDLSDAIATQLKLDPVDIRVALDGSLVDGREVLAEVQGGTSAKPYVVVRVNVPSSVFVCVDGHPQTVSFPVKDGTIKFSDLALLVREKLKSGRLWKQVRPDQGSNSPLREILPDEIIEAGEVLVFVPSFFRVYIEARHWAGENFRLGVRSLANSMHLDGEIYRTGRGPEYKVVLDVLEQGLATEFIEALAQQGAAVDEAFRCVEKEGIIKRGFHVGAASGGRDDEVGSANVGDGSRAADHDSLYDFMFA